MTEGDAEQNPVGPAPHSKRQEWLAFGALGAIHLSMAVFFVLSRWGLSSPEDKVDAFVFSILRMVFACIIVVAVMKVTVKDLTIPWSGPVFHKLLGVSVFGGVVPVLCFSLGVMLSSATNAAIISVTQPVFTAAIAMIFKVDPFIGRKVAGICVSIAGALAMLNLQNFKLDGATVGNLFLLLQQSALSIYNVLNRKLVSESHLHYGVITAWTLIFGSSGITIISIPFVATPEVWHITWKGWYVLLNQSLHFFWVQILILLDKVGDWLCYLLRRVGLRGILVDSEAHSPHGLRLVHHDSTVSLRTVGPFLPGRRVWLATSDGWHSRRDWPRRGHIHGEPPARALASSARC